MHGREICENGVSHPESQYRLCSSYRMPFPFIHEEKNNAPEDSFRSNWFIFVYTSVLMVQICSMPSRPSVRDRPSGVDFSCVPATALQPFNNTNQKSEIVNRKSLILPTFGTGLRFAPHALLSNRRKIQIKSEI